MIASYQNNHPYHYYQYTPKHIMQVREMTMSKSSAIPYNIPAINQLMDVSIYERALVDGRSQVTLVSSP